MSYGRSGLYDFIIIGGGIAGVSAAASLSNLGKTLVLESEEALAFHASGRSAAMFIVTYGNPSVCVLNRASEDHLKSCAGGTGVLSPRGLMAVARSDQREAFEAVREADNMHEVSIGEALKLVPILDSSVVSMAALKPDIPDIDTDLLLQDFARQARANGTEISLKSEVTGISRTSNGWVVTSRRGTFETRNVVNAAGAWADVIAKAAGVPPIGLTPMRRSMARIPAPGGHDVSSWPFILDAGMAWYAKPDAGKLLVSPSEEDPQPPHDAFADDMVLAEGIARYEATVTEPVTRVENSWAGLRTFAPDRSLVLGPDPVDPAFIWCAAQGGYGFQTAAAASRFLADVLSGQPDWISKAEADTLLPSRFRT